MEIHVVDLNGSNDRVVYAVPREEARFVQNVHLSWPDRVKDWFVASIFPSARNLPRHLQDATGRGRPDSRLGEAPGCWPRTHTAITTREEDFWAQPLASPSADGSRVSFNSNRLRDASTSTSCGFRRIHGIARVRELPW